MPPDVCKTPTTTASLICTKNAALAPSALFSPTVRAPNDDTKPHPSVHIQQCESSESHAHSVISVTTLSINNQHGLPV
nr:hypothetical protein HmN_000229000 [Hymenolepis microstoma]